MSWDTTAVENGGVTDAGKIGAAEWNTMVSEIKRVVTTKTGAYTAVNMDIILCNGTFTITMPNPAADDLVDVKNIGTGTVTIGGGGNTIDGDATIYLYSQYESVSLVSDGTNWWIL